MARAARIDRASRMDRAAGMDRATGIDWAAGMARQLKNPLLSWIRASTSGGSQSPVTLAPGDLTPFLTSMDIPSCAYIQTDTHL